MMREREGLSVLGEGDGTDEAPGPESWSVQGKVGCSAWDTLANLGRRARGVCTGLRCLVDTANLPSVEAGYTGGLGTNPA